MPAVNLYISHFCHYITFDVCSLWLLHFMFVRKDFDMFSFFCIYSFTLLFFIKPHLMKKTSVCAIWQWVHSHVLRCQNSEKTASQRGLHARHPCGVYTPVFSGVFTPGLHISLPCLQENYSSFDLPVQPKLQDGRHPTHRGTADSSWSRRDASYKVSGQQLKLDEIF